MLYISERAAANWLQAIILVSFAAAILLSDAPYLHDFAVWLYQSQILKNLMVQPELVPGFSVHPYPVPNSLVVAVMAAISSVLPPILAGKTTLLLIVGAWWLVLQRFAARHFAPELRPTLALFLLGTVVFAPFFWYGFVSYQVGLMLFLWFLARDGQQPSVTDVAVFSLLIFFAHGMVFLVFGLYVAMRALLHREPATLAALLPAALLSCWFLYGRESSAFVAPVADANWSGMTEALLYKFGFPAMLGPFRNLLRPDGSSLLEAHAWVYWVGFVTNFAVAGFVALFGLHVAWKNRALLRPGNTKASTLDRTCLATACVLALFYLFAPYNFYGVFNPGGRVLLPMLALLMIVGRADVAALVRRLAWPVGLFTLVTCIGYLALTSPRSDGFMLEQIAPRSRALPDHSVFEFNRALYAKAGFRYFNYRIFAHARRFEQIARQEFPSLGLPVGMLKREDSPSPGD